MSGSNRGTCVRRECQAGLTGAGGLGCPQKKEEAAQPHTNGKSTEHIELDLHVDRHRRVQAPPAFASPREAHASLTRTLCCPGCLHDRCMLRSYKQLVDMHGAASMGRS